MKNTKLGYVIILISFILFNIIAFVFPVNRTTTFWIAYAFTVVPFFTQLFTWHSFSNNKTIKSKFLNIPTIYISITYLIIQLIVFALFMIFSSIASWIVIVLCALILLISFICMITTELGLGEIKRVEEKVKKETMFIKTIQTDIELIISKEHDVKIKKALTKLVEIVRYSDPMSDESLDEIETQISKKVLELKNSNDKMTVINEITSLFVERNKKSKINKG